MQDLRCFTHLDGHLTNVMRPMLTQRVSCEGVHTAEPMMMRFALKTGEFFVMYPKFDFAFSATPAEWCEFDRQPYRSLLLNAETPPRNHRPRAVLVIAFYMPGAHRSEAIGPLSKGFIPKKIIQMRFCTDGRS